MMRDPHGVQRVDAVWRKQIRVNGINYAQGNDECRIYVAFTWISRGFRTLKGKWKLVIGLAAKGV